MGKAHAVKRQRVKVVQVIGNQMAARRQCQRLLAKQADPLKVDMGGSQAAELRKTIASLVYQQRNTVGAPADSIGTVHDIGDGCDVPARQGQRRDQGSLGNAK